MTCMNASTVKWQALIGRHLIVTYLRTKPAPIYRDPTERPCQKGSHQLYAFQHVYLGRASIKPLKNAMGGVLFTLSCTIKELEHFFVYKNDF